MMVYQRKGQAPGPASWSTLLYGDSKLVEMRMMQHDHTRTVAGGIRVGNGFPKRRQIT